LNTVTEENNETYWILATRFERRTAMKQIQYSA